MNSYFYKVTERIRFDSRQGIWDIFNTTVFRTVPGPLTRRLETFIGDLTFGIKLTTRLHQVYKICGILSLFKLHALVG